MTGACTSKSSVLPISMDPGASNEGTSPSHLASVPAPSFVDDLASLRRPSGPTELDFDVRVLLVPKVDLNSFEVKKFQHKKSKSMVGWVIPARGARTYEVILKVSSSWIKFETKNKAH